MNFDKKLLLHLISGAQFGDPYKIILRQLVMALDRISPCKNVPLFYLIHISYTWILIDFCPFTAPINLEYTESNQYLFKDGYFFSTGPAFYKQGQFGIRLENVLEVISTEKRLPSGAKFLRFQDMTLVPYDPKLIERALLSSQEVIDNSCNANFN